MNLENNRIKELLGDKDSLIGVYRGPCSKGLTWTNFTVGKFYVLAHRTVVSDRITADTIDDDGLPDHIFMDNFDFDVTPEPIEKFKRICEI